MISAPLLKLTSAQVVATTNANNSLSQDFAYAEPEDQTQSRYAAPGFKPFPVLMIFVVVFFFLLINLQMLLHSFEFLYSFFFFFPGDSITSQQLASNRTEEDCISWKQRLHAKRGRNIFFYRKATGN